MAQAPQDDGVETKGSGIPVQGLGYFKNDKLNACIKVNNDFILYNQFESKDNPKRYKNGDRTVVRRGKNFFNILAQSFFLGKTYPLILGIDCGFEYDDWNDEWIMGGESGPDDHTSIDHKSIDHKSIDNKSNDCLDLSGTKWKRAS